MESFWNIIATLSVVVTACIYQYYRSVRKLPPGPYGLPFVGYAPFLGKNPLATLTKLRETYGNVVSVTLGMSTVVVLNDWDAVKEALIKQNEVFNGRQQMILSEIIFEDSDIIHSDGPKWKEQKKCALNILREYGFGKSSLEGVIVDEIDKLAVTLTKLSGSPVAITKLFFVSITNIIWQLVAGKRFEVNDEHISSFKGVLYDAVPGKWSLINFLPHLRHFIPGGLGFDIVEANARRVKQYFVNEVNEHLENFNGDCQKDFTDSYLADIMKHKINGIEQPPFDRKHLMATLLGLFFAGVETVDTALCWAILYMAAYPDIQKKVQDELDSLVAADSFIEQSSRHQAPYTQATIKEVLRIATVTPLAVPHRTTKPTTLLGHRIPKDTTIFVNLHAVHHDRRYWTDPDVFRPERFLVLDEDGKVKKHDCFCPFSAGARLCLGESLAKQELFLFFSCLMRRFTFQMNPDKQMPTFEPDVRSIFRPKPFELIVNRR